MAIINIAKFLQKDDGSRFNQFFAVLSASVALFSSGLHGGWTSPSLEKIMSPEYPFEITEEDASYVAIIGPVGDVVGGILASALVDVIGRKNTILLTSIPQILFMSSTYFSYYGKELLYFARILGGVGQGASLAIIPMYAAEIADPEIRGLFGVFISITYMSGVVFINLIGSFFDIHMTALICLSFPIIFIILFSSMPESPYYLLMKQKVDESLKALKFFRRKNNVEKELLLLTNDVARQMSESGTFKDVFLIKSNRKAFFMVIAARTFQQYSGCTAFAMYIQILLKESTSISPVIGSSLIFLTQILVNIGTIYFIDRLGRKPLFTFSSATTFLTLLIQGIFFSLRDYSNIDMTSLSWFPLFNMVLFTICFSSGLGIGLNILTSEIYSTSIKSKAVSLGSVIFAIGMISSTKFYQATADNYGLAIPFFSFAIVEFFGILFFAFVLPETKGKTLEAIQQELKGRKSQKTNQLAEINNAI